MRHASNCATTMAGSATVVAVNGGCSEPLQPIKRTGLAQQQIIAAVLGAISEDPKMFGKGLFFIVLPETLVIFGLVIAIMLMGRI